MSKMYVSADGNYGDGDSLVILDCDLLNDKLYELIDIARDNERYEIALAVSNNDTQRLSEIANEYDIELEITK